jgi:hypothetical protein
VHSVPFIRPAGPDVAGRAGRRESLATGQHRRLRRQTLCARASLQVLWIASSSRGYVGEDRRVEISSRAGNDPPTSQGAGAATGRRARCVLATGQAAVGSSKTATWSENELLHTMRRDVSSESAGAFHVACHVLRCTAEHMKSEVFSFRPRVHRSCFRQLSCIRHRSQLIP